MAVTDGQTSDRLAALEAELARAQARLRELDHRVKNDLQLIASVFVMQSRRAAEGPERAAIRSALERLNALTAVHRRLDVAGEPSRMEASGLVREVAQEAAAGARRGDVRLSFDLVETSIPARQAAPLAIVTGELVRNCLRHAFPDRAGVVEVSLRDPSGTIELLVADDGQGYDGAPATRGFGLTLAALLAQQLRGHLEVAPAEPGCRALVRFPASP